MICGSRPLPIVPPRVLPKLPVSEDNLRQTARAGYEGALNSDRDQQSHTVALFLTDDSYRAAVTEKPRSTREVPLKAKSEPAYSIVGPRAAASPDAA
jgi:hypothetical protein